MTPSPGGDRLYVTQMNASAPGTPRISIVETSTGNQTPVDLAGQIPDFSTMSTPTITPDGTRLYAVVITQTDAGEGASRVAVIDVDPGSSTYLDVVDLIGEDSLGGVVPIGGSVNFSPDGSTAYVPVGIMQDSGQAVVLGIAILDTRDNSLITTVPFAAAPTGIALSSDGIHGYITSLVIDENGQTEPDSGAISIITIAAPNTTLVVATSPDATAYTEHGAPVVVDDGLTVTDTDSSTLTGAT